MRTNIVLDDELVKNGLEISGLSTKKELITVALKEFIKNRTRFDIKELKGKIRFAKGYDYKTLRKGN
ncbi:MAG: type II toxin-antitoxin system VapB family antitoxin [Candidatus Anammoxibacter sp.]